MLRDYNCSLCYGSEFTTSKFIDEMVEIIEILLFSLHILNGQLQLTLNFAKKHVVYKNVIILFI